MDVPWSMIFFFFFFFFWVIWIWIVITVLIDVFRRDDIGGWAKAAWVIFVVILPWLGVLIYLIAQHDGMQQRSVKRSVSGTWLATGFFFLRDRVDQELLYPARSHEFER